MYSLVDFFVDPLLRAPVIGSMLIGFILSLVGVVVFIRKKSLIGEMLSHASYPGLVLSGILLASCSSSFEESHFMWLILGSFLSSLFSLVFLHFLQSRFRVKSDAALCFILSSFFGMGILLASAFQGIYPVWHKQIQLFLYGQVATMPDSYIQIYAALALLLFVGLVLLYRSLELLYFDRSFARLQGLSIPLWEGVFFMLLAICAPIAMKSVGIVLFSGMLIAPALGARKLSDHLATIFCLAALIGTLSGFLGNYLATQCSTSSLLFPTGPMIVLCAAFFALMASLLAPKNGWIVLGFKRRALQRKMQGDNLLELVRSGKTVEEVSMLLRQSPFFTKRRLEEEARRGRVYKKEGRYFSRGGA